MLIETIVAIVAIASVSIAMIIDSTAWHIRGLARVEERGAFISKTNIFLYGGRFFSLLYMTALAYLVDIGGTASEIILVSATGFFVSSIANQAILGTRKVRKRFVETVAYALHLPARECDIDADHFRIFSRSALENRLFLYSSLATLIFSMGISVPYVVASIFPEYRMTFNNLGQIINSIGMLMVLLVIDNRMYKDWDKGSIRESNEYYTSSRTAGLMIASTFYFSANFLIAIIE
ncbi:hypothetical protein [Sphingopyxis alaskensis]|uniref:hypothetical protein n=1 Tax=Sphingopyxis alaskensis TaxID=117207 RepID=UPI00391C5013